MEYVPDNYDQFLIRDMQLSKKEQEEDNEQFIPDNREL
jgi:hypothetical protein